EYGIRAFHVTGVQTCALPISGIGCNGGGAAGFVIGMEGKRVYHAGDTALFSDMKLIGELCHPDVALLPIGGRFTMGPEEAMIARSEERRVGKESRTRCAWRRR